MNAIDHDLPDRIVAERAAGSSSQTVVIRSRPKHVEMRVRGHPDLLCTSPCRQESDKAPYDAARRAPTKMIEEWRRRARKAKRICRGRVVESSSPVFGSWPS